MLIFDKDINAQVKQDLDACTTSLKIIMYSISCQSSRSHAMYAATWKSLQSAIKRAKSTQIIFSGWPTTNPQHQITSRASQLLIAAGAEIRTGKAGVIIHPKAWLFDDKTLIVGSHNYTEAGFMRSANISYRGSCVAEIAQFSDYFEKQWVMLSKLK